MKISTRGRYALILMLDLANHNRGVPVPLKETAKRQQISEKYLEQIISVLNKSLRKESKVVQTKKQYWDFSLTALSFASISIFPG